jgi:hypothetical protein
MAHNDELERVLKDLKSQPTVPIWPHVGVVLGISRNAAYAAAKSKEIDVIQVGRLKKAVSASLRKRLGIEA